MLQISAHYQQYPAGLPSTCCRRLDPLTTFMILGFLRAFFHPQKVWLLEGCWKAVGRLVRLLLTVPKTNIPPKSKVRRWHQWKYLDQIKVSCLKLDFLWVTSTLPETSSSPLKIGMPHREMSSSNHPFTEGITNKPGTGAFVCPTKPNPPKSARKCHQTTGSFRKIWQILQVPSSSHWLAWQWASLGTGHLSRHGGRILSPTVGIS